MKKIRNRLKDYLREIQNIFKSITRKICKSTRNMKYTRGKVLKVNNGKFEENYNENI